VRKTRIHDEEAVMAPNDSPAGRPALPQLGRPMVTDGGLETDLIFNHGVDLPEFAAFPLLEDDDGRRLLRQYYDGYAAVARSAGGAGLLLESPPWRANPDWGTLLGWSGDSLRRVNQASIAFLHGLREAYSESIDEIVVCGMVGPRGDGYAAGTGVDPDEAADYHSAQATAFADAGADVVTAYTLTDPGEAIGVVRAARAADVPVAISLTVEPDGRLPGGISVADAVAAVDSAAAPDYYLLNCAHPTHIAAGLPEALGASAWTARVAGLRYNASTRSHAELDEATELDAGDLDTLRTGHDALATAFPAVTILGGCCGTDSRHVAALWGATA
jgi:homocysteine S-methyltransferase